MACFSSFAFGVAGRASAGAMKPLGGKQRGGKNKAGTLAPIEASPAGTSRSLAHLDENPTGDSSSLAAVGASAAAPPTLAPLNMPVPSLGSIGGLAGMGSSALLNSGGDRPSSAAGGSGDDSSEGPLTSRGTARGSARRGASSKPKLGNAISGRPTLRKASSSSRAFRTGGYS